MSVKYAPSKLGVPEGFQNLLAGLLKAVLREQPTDIIQFADAYFKLKLEHRKAGISTENENAGRTVNKDDLEYGMSRVTTSERKLSMKGDEEEAAIKIQSVMRGALARKEVNEIKASSSTNVDKAADGNDLNVDDMGEASEEELSAVALKMQANFRGQKARKEVDELRKGSEGNGEETSEDVSVDNAEVSDVTTEKGNNEALDNTIKNGDDTKKDIAESAEATTGATDEGTTTNEVDVQKDEGTTKVDEQEDKGTTEVDDQKNEGTTEVDVQEDEGTAEIDSTVADGISVVE